MSRALWDLIETATDGAQRMRLTRVTTRKFAESLALKYQRRFGRSGYTYAVQRYAPGRCWDCAGVHAPGACTRKGDA